MIIARGWSMVLNMAFVNMTVGYAALWRLLGFSLVACGRKIWLRVGPIWLIDVIDCDVGPVTIVLDMNVCRDIVATTDYFVAL